MFGKKKPRPLVDKREYESILSWCQCLVAAANDFERNIESLDLDETEDKDLDRELARGIMYLEDAIRHIRQERNNNLKW